MNRSKAKAAAELVSLANREKKGQQRSAEEGGGHEKLNQVVQTAREKEIVAELRRNHYEGLEASRVKRRGHLGRADYDRATKEITVQDSPDTKIYQNMGVSGRKGTRLLFAEEAVLLQEMGMMEICCEGMPLSVQEGFRLILESHGVPLAHYSVFSALTRKGYILRPCHNSPVPPLKEDERAGNSSPAVSASTSTSTVLKEESAKASGEKEGSPCGSPKAKRMKTPGEVEDSPIVDIDSGELWPDAVEDEQPLQNDRSESTKMKAIKNSLFPSDQGGQFTFLGSISSHLLPDSLRGLKFDEQVCDARAFSTDPQGRRQDRKRDKKEFFRENGWRFLPAKIQESSSWAEFRRRRNAWLEECKAGSSGRGLWEGYSVPLVPPHERQDAQSSKITTDIHLVYDLYPRTDDFARSRLGRPDFKVAISSNPTAPLPLSALHEVSRRSQGVPVLLAYNMAGTMSFFKLTAQDAAPSSCHI